MVGDDVALARHLYDVVDAHPELEACTCELSITTFRYVPSDIPPDVDREEHLTALNRALLERLQSGGEAFVSNAVVEGRYMLRACIVNFRTTRTDVEALAEIVVRHGRAVAGAGTLAGR
jgi:glutamate/tyrosine decarboxylase-like PLP-dependent enzyme